MSMRGTTTTGTGSIPASSIKVDMSELYQLEADATPLVALTQKLGKTRTVDNPQYYALELRPLAQSTPTAGYLIGDTDIVVTDAGIFNIDDRIVNMRTFENMLATAINYGTNTLTVTRAIGSTAAAAGNAADTILRLGQAKPEASSMPVSVLNQETNAYNYTQIFREAYSIAGTAKATAQYTGDREKLQIAQCMRKVKGDMEMSWFWGERGIQNASTTPRRFTGGMKSQIVTNTYNPASTITFAQFSDNVLAAAGRYGSNQKLLFAGENIIRCLDRWAFDKMFLYSDDDSLGFKTKRVTSSFVDLVVVRHKLFRGTALANKGFIVDADNIRRVVLRGRDMHWEKEIQANDFDGKAGNILAEVGFELTLEETHMYLDGISGPT